MRSAWQVAVGFLVSAEVANAQAAAQLSRPASATSTASSPMVAASPPTAASTAPVPAACAAPTNVAEHVSPGDVVVSNAATTSSSSGSGGPVPGELSSGARPREWTVHVASYESLDEAERMQQALCQKGYEARIVGAGRPYGVRVGRYPTSKAALEVARHLRAPRLTVFVTPAE